MHKKRIRASIVFLSLSMLTFIGISWYLIYNTYKLELNKFDLASTPIVSASFFNAEMNYQPFRFFAEDFDKLIENKESISNEQYQEMIYRLKEAFIFYSKTDSVIREKLLEKGMDIEMDVAISLAKITSHETNTYQYSEDAKRLGEILLFGKANLIETGNYKSFSKWVGKYYMEIRMYYEYKNIAQYILNKIKWFIAGLVLATFFFAAIFTFTIRTIIRQKKLADIKNDFINNMTHELNTPISTIKISGQNLKKDEIKSAPGKVEEIAEVLLRQNKRLAKIVSGVMKLSVHSKQEDFQVQQTNFKDFLSELIRDFSATNPDVNIQQNLTDENLTVNIDPFHMGSAILNILDNAVKYSGKDKKIMISTEHGRQKLILKIRDFGIGIAKAHQSFIFDKFYRVPKGNIHAVKGLGLGLYIVKQIVDTHGGKIKVDSKAEKGSTFIIEIPL